MIYSELDAFDRRILIALQADATQSTAAIAEQVGLSQAPCWRRIQRMKEAGIITGQIALIDRRRLGFHTTVFAEVKLSATGRANVDAFIAAIQGLAEVTDCHMLLGKVDFLLRIVTRDNEAYERFFYEKLSTAPGVQDINSIVALSDIKAMAPLPIAAEGL